MWYEVLHTSQAEWQVVLRGLLAESVRAVGSRWWCAGDLLPKQAVSCLHILTYDVVPFSVGCTCFGILN